MRILYIDCDSLRPDHLGCYGYHRETSPNVDDIAADGRTFTNVYTSDAPCLPSRTAFYTGRFGIHTGVINHGGRNADPRRHGSSRRANYPDRFRTLGSALSDAGIHTTMISPFPDRHDAWQVVEGFRELYDTGGNGGERADEVYPYARDWLEEHAAEDDWYCHVNFWDPHTPYRTPEEYGNPFTDEPAPEWLTEELIEQHYGESGPHSAQDLKGWVRTWDRPRMPPEISSRAEFETMVDGYDVGVRYMDRYIGKLFDLLREQGVFDETLVVISGDHGENLGELNVYGDHQLADDKTCRVPLVVRGPGVEPGTDDALRYQLDLAPTLVDLVGGDAPGGWDGRSFADAVTEGTEGGRDELILSQGAWTCQRSVRWDDWLLFRTYHDAYRSRLEDVMLFDLASDPHETTDLSAEEPSVVDDGLARLQCWHDDRLLEAARGERGGNPDTPNGVTDPMWQVLAEKGPYYTWDRLEDYVDHLEKTDREEHAAALAERLR
ncbi:sulfatase [Natronococcus sp. JC468]|uniref:sulfatase n=1 Tax=Natronococcus sp. JC468 TaxID=1961921 RepID=UPI00143B290C|nr:sulfatase [Natronococcus sp. JC468]NKE36099.1 sulfatase [Natronococcus sp. JC468]